jgi:hypothetical protein
MGGGWNPPDLTQLSSHALNFGSKPSELVDADPRNEGDWPALPLEPDPRWQDSMVGTRSDLEQEASRWETHPGVPEQIARMLTVSRRLFIHSYFVHEFAVVAVVWSLLAVESSLRFVLDVSLSDRTGFKKLITRAHVSGLLTEEETIQLDAGREFRNRLVHTEGQTAFTLGMSVPLLATTHSLVVRLFERADVFPHDDSRTEV